MAIIVLFFLLFEHDEIELSAYCNMLEKHMVASIKVGLFLSYLYGVLQ